MAGLFHEAVTRQQFLRASAGLCCGVLLTRLGLPGSSLAQENIETAPPDDAMSLALALLSDTHIPADANEAYRGFRPYDNLQQIVPQVIERKPQAVIIDGDAARLEGKLADYEQLRTLLQPLADVAPIGIGLGNHDDRQNFGQVFNGTNPFADQSVSGKHVVVFEHAVVRVIVLDSLMYVNEVAGLLGKQQREWLAGYLTAQDNRPTVLFVHHTLGDEDGELLDVDRLYSIVEPHRNVKAIFFGHSHRYELTRRGRLHLVNLPAVGYNFSDDQPVGWIEGMFQSTGCALTLRAIGGNRANDGQTNTLAWA